MKKLNLKELEYMEPGTIFAQGIAVDSQSCLFLAGTGNKVRWVAKRGRIADWSIYAQNPHYGELAQSFYSVAKWGNKVKDYCNIKRLIDADDDAMDAYRY